MDSLLNFAYRYFDLPEGNYTEDQIHEFIITKKKEQVLHLAPDTEQIIQLESFNIPLITQSNNPQSFKERRIAVIIKGFKECITEHMTPYIEKTLNENISPIFPYNFMSDFKFKDQFKTILEQEYDQFLYFFKTFFSEIDQNSSMLLIHKYELFCLLHKFYEALFYNPTNETERLVNKVFKYLQQCQVSLEREIKDLFYHLEHSDVFTHSYYIDIYFNLLAYPNYRDLALDFIYTQDVELHSYVVSSIVNRNFQQWDELIHLFNESPQTIDKITIIDPESEHEYEYNYDEWNDETEWIDNEKFEDEEYKNEDEPIKPFNTNAKISQEEIIEKLNLVYEAISELMQCSKNEFIQMFFHERTNKIIWRGKTTELKAIFILLLEHEYFKIIENEPRINVKIAKSFKKESEESYTSKEVGKNVTKENYLQKIPLALYNMIKEKAY